MTPFPTIKVAGVEIDRKHYFRLFQDDVVVLSQEKEEHYQDFLSRVSQWCKGREGVWDKGPHFQTSFPDQLAEWSLVPAQYMTERRHTTHYYLHNREARRVISFVSYGDGMLLFSTYFDKRVEQWEHNATEQIGLSRLKQHVDEHRIRAWL